MHIIILYNIGKKMKKCFDNQVDIVLLQNSCFVYTCDNNIMHIYIICTHILPLMFNND